MAYLTAWILLHYRNTCIWYNHLFKGKFKSNWLTYYAKLTSIAVNMLRDLAVQPNYEITVNGLWLPFIIYRFWLDTSYSAPTTANISLSLPRKSINAVPFNKKTLYGYTNKIRWVWLIMARCFVMRKVIHHIWIL